MKEKDAQVDYKQHQMVLFVEGEDGTYTTLQTGSFLSKNYLDDFWVKRTHLEQVCLRRLCEGEISPVHYHMILTDMAPADVAARVGISTSLVRKHMDPRRFEKMRISLARRYAEVFGIPLTGLFQVVVQPVDGRSISHEATRNPSVVITRCAADSNSKGEERVKERSP